MANFMNKIKTPKPIKPIAVKPITEVKKDEKVIVAEEKIEEVKIPEPEEKVEETPEKSEPVVADEAIEKSEDEVRVLEDVKYLDKEKKKKFKELKGSANSEVDLNKMRDELKAEEDDKLEDKAIEEIIEDANKEPEPEPEKPKAKKKSSRKKKKEEPVEVKQNKEPVSIEEAEDVMMETIMPCSTGWNEEKERVNGMLDKIVITEELDPTSVKSLIADMSSTLRELIMLSTESKTALSNLKDTIEEVKVANSTGVNSEERKMNAMYAMKNYEKDGQVVDLTELLKFYRERQEFYDAAVRQIEINRQMLITFGSVFKLELAKAY